MTRKKTIGGETGISGIGIHSGKVVDVVIKPSDAGEIVFRRTDLNGLEITLDPRKIEARNSSCLASGECRILTIEHLLASLFACEIDSIVIELNGGEIPIMDGSALPIVTAVKEAGTRELDKERKYIRIVRPFEIRENDTSIAVSPDPEFRVTYIIEFNHPAIRRQEMDFVPSLEGFVEQIAPARTFGFLKDLPDLNRRGLALGGTFANAVVLDEEKVVNRPLRYPDEFVRHKVLDLLGDLYLLGCPIIGSFKAVKAGHSLHLKLVNHLLDHPESWSYD